jgi:Uma2 family endonuclease
MPPVAEQTAVHKDWTPEEFLALPDSVGYELVDGELVERNVSEESSAVGVRIAYLLQTENEKSREARIYGSDLSYKCFADRPKNFRRADVSLVRKARLEGLNNPGMMPIPADLVVEVLSPNDHIYDVNDKVELYLANGFPLVWIVDPEVKIVYVHRADGSVTKLHENEEITGESALPTFRCRVAEFFKI